MAIEQWSDTIRNAWLATIESTLGTSPKIELRTGASPSNVAASDSGTLLVTCTGPSDWLATPSAGVAAFVSSFTGTVSVAGVVGHFRLKTSGGTCHSQGDVTQSFPLTTSSSTAANNNVLTFASTSGVSIGMSISGTGVPSGALVQTFTSTTVTMSLISTAGVSSSAVIYFGDTAGKLWLPNMTLSVSQFVNITRSFTAPGA